jgi:hypothetical protein
MINTYPEKGRYNPRGKLLLYLSPPILRMAGGRNKNEL